MGASGYGGERKAVIARLEWTGGVDNQPWLHDRQFRRMQPVEHLYGERRSCALFDKIALQGLETCLPASGQNDLQTVHPGEHPGEALSERSSGADQENASDQDATGASSINRALTSGGGIMQTSGFPKSR